MRILQDIRYNTLNFILNLKKHFNINNFIYQ